MSYKYLVEIRDDGATADELITEDLKEANTFAYTNGLKGDLIVISEGYTDSIGAVIVTDRVASWVI